VIPGVNCMGCAFWNALPAKHGRPETRGQCRARAPNLVTTPQGQIFTSWPLTKEDDWCGDHSTIEEEA
jgi:hypothetical protein